MFKKRALILLSVMLFVCLVAVFAGCLPNGDKYTVTYDKGDDAATGTAPESAQYAEGETVTVADNPFTLANSEFVGWKADGSDTVYKEGDTFQMPNKNVKLVAQWKAGGSTDTWNGHELVTVADVLAQIPDEASSDIDYKQYLRVTVKSIDNASYGQMTVTDSTGEIIVWGTRASDGTTYYDKMDAASKPVAGDTVVLYTQTITNYKGTKEIKLAWIMDVEKAATPPFDINDYAAKNVSEARSEAVGTKVVVQGVVARITYANGMKPNGFFLVDDTNSIYVYDSQIAPQVKVGNTVKIAGERDNWILDTEQASAAKFGYTGCIQLSNAHLVDKSDATQTPEFGWVTPKTVKEIMDTPVTDNITTTVYKVNALIKKTPGAGFVNYYIDDIDGKTGSYCYTQCNGNDYQWLDEFNGKICTVYLSVINAKSTATGCVWRFVPVQVSFDDYKFDEKNAPQFALDYYGVDQFAATYQSDPSLEVVTEVTSELLGLTENITLRYTSDNEGSVKFETSEGKTVMHTLAVGKATVTITAAYKTYTANTTVKITVEEKPTYTAVTVAQAIAAELESEVTVKGIVGPSLVNQVGFYLIDDSGVIAIKLPDEEMEKISLGDEVTLKGTRTQFKGTQTCLLDCEILLNEFGGHDYSTQTFVKGKTLTEIFNADKPDTYTAVVYVVEAEVKVVSTKNYTNVYLKDGETELLLYAASGSQYSFVSKYEGQRVTVELALCAWNSGTKGCVLSVTDSQDVKTVNTLNFSK